jgi:ribonuclease J
VRVKIHRGAHEIGGSCVEVEAQGSTLVLDVGTPLSSGWDEVVALPDVAGFIGTDPTLLGVIVTHAHQDHWGLVGQIDPQVPVFMGAATHRILAEAEFWTKGLSVTPTGFLEHRAPFELGPFRITPYLNDHSAYDAYSLLVEADGRRLFYTGDIRGHGRKARLFTELLSDPPTAVDVLLMEGTNIRPDSDEDVENDQAESETAVERAMVETIRATSGLVLAMSSAQNLDRLVTIYRAMLQSDRDLVMDLYGASIAGATGNPNIPQPGPEWPRVHVYVPIRQRVTVKNARAFERVNAIRPYRVYEDYIARRRSELVMMFSMVSGPALEKAGALEGATVIWSLWDGYLTEPSGQRLQTFLSDQSIPLVQHHTSGHASIADLKRLAAAIHPGRLVPIHSFAADRFVDHFAHVTQEDDGAWWEV